MRFILTFLFANLLSFIATSQNYSIKASVLLWVETEENPASITLNWIKDPDATNYYIFRKNKTANSWGNAIANVSKDSSRYVDKTIEVGKGYEYRVSKVSPTGNGFGYVYASIKLPATEIKGSILLLVDSTINARLKTEINIWKSDLANEAWNVLTYVPTAKNTVVDIRTKIIDLKKLNPDLKTIFILGHVKVPYSGDIAPDGHVPDHLGAWPTDAYYGDLDGNWTDVLVSDPGANRAENKNIIGDGKFDQSSIPSDIDLEVGRADFANLPAFSKNEVELTRAYLNKNHLWRTGQIKAEKRGIVLDNFNFANEAFGQTGMKNFSVFFNPANVEYGNYRDSLRKKSYLCSYGSGSGSYTSAGGISTSQNMATDSLQTVFTFLFGSYFGDWDSQNNFMRSALGSGTILTCAWAGRPHWAVHHMAMGDHIGYGARLSMNNTVLYNAGSSPRSIHIALLGDPSLAMFPMAAVSSLEAVESGPHIELRWTRSAAATDGYYIYRKTEGNTQFDVIAKNVTDTVYKDLCPRLGFKFEYMIRAVKLETNASGSFYNLSEGIRDTITKLQAGAPKSDFVFTTDYEFIHLKSESKNTRNVKWVIGKDTLNASEIDAILDCNKTSQEVCLIAEGDCDQDIHCKTIGYACSIPTITKIKQDTIPCFGGKASIEIEDLLGADPFTFNWSTGGKTNKITNVAAGNYSVTITSAKNTENIYNFTISQPADINATFNTKSANPGKKDGGISNLNISGGTAPFTFKINNEKLDSLAAGDYNLIITDANQCEKIIKITIPIRTAVSDVDRIDLFELYPTITKDYITIKLKSSIKPESLILLNAEGKIIRTLNLQDGKINIQSLSPGYYFIQCISVQGNQRRAFEKM
ncbi:MAG: T9SS type A sorting domain-containing protein [Saprospiraceae bacterium]|nr:T9SS type A sorting domain-containing protein [Saprospiraceae bacterium]